jgi:integrase
MASAAVAGGQDPAAEKAEDRRAITFAKLVDAFLAKHVQAKLKARTYESYKHLLYTNVVPEIGTSQAVKVGRADIARLHLQWKATPHHANSAVRVIRSMYGWAASEGLVPETFNPARGVKPYRTLARERFLTSAEIERLGVALRLAENEGIPWAVNPDKPKSKHIPKEELNRRIVIGPHAAGAIKLLIFTGCRLREILHLEWSHVDLERGLLLLSDSKTGRKTVILNAPALRVLGDLPRVGKFVIAGDYGAVPRADLKRPWQAVTRAAGLDGLRIHDLRHNFASFGAAGGLGLPIIGRLLGHSQPATTARYAHLDSDPLRRASDVFNLAQDSLFPFA